MTKYYFRNPYSVMKDSIIPITLIRKNRTNQLTFTECYRIVRIVTSKSTSLLAEQNKINLRLCLYYNYNYTLETLLFDLENTLKNPDFLTEEVKKEFKEWWYKDDKHYFYLLIRFCLISIFMYIALLTLNCMIVVYWYSLQNKEQSANYISN